MLLNRFYVATVLTACGIETYTPSGKLTPYAALLQQYLPLAVLKLKKENSEAKGLTGCNSTYRLRY